MDRTNISLALEKEILSMMKDLLMNDRMAGDLAGIFFLGISCSRSREAIWRPLERPENHQPAAGFLGGVRGGLRACADVPGIRSDALPPGRG